MARTTPRPRPTATQTLTPLLRHCPTCGNAMWAASHHYRTLTTLTAGLRLTRKIRRCLTPDCPQFQPPYRPEEAGRLALPTHACGLDGIAVVGTLRHAQHRRVPERSQALRQRQSALAPRTVLHLLERSDARVARALADPLRLQRVTTTQGRVVFALDGLPPDVGHEVRWVLRAGLSSEVLLARSLLSAPQEDVADRRREVKRALGGPIVGVLSDGPPSLRCAVAKALPAVPPPLGHCHSWRAAATPVSAADRPAKQARKKRRRGVRPIAHQVAKRTDPEAAGIRGSCSAVRRARTADGPPPLAAAGLTRHDRLSALSQSLERVATRGACPHRCSACTRSTNGA
jgi:hypothetical protein